MTREEEIRQYALNLQLQGPDEFPFGYYLYLAERHFNEEEE